MNSARIDEVSRELWQSTLPAWDPDKLVALFRRQQLTPSPEADGTPLSAAERNELALQLMHVVAIKFASRGYHFSLWKLGIDPRDAAAIALSHLMTKLPAIRIEKWETHHATITSKDRRLLLLSYLYLAVERRISSMVQAEQARAAREGTATDRVHRRNREGANDHSMDCLAAGSVGDVEEDLRRLREALRAAEGDVVLALPGDINSLVVLARWMRLAIVRGEGCRTAYCHLPPRLAKKVHPLVHAIALSRMIRIVEAVAA